MVNDKIDTTEVVDRLKNIIHIHCLVSDTDGVCLKDITRLIMSQLTTFNMIGIVGQVNLSTMIDAAF